MPKYTDSRIVPYTRDDMFNLVGTVENYPHFLPWVKAARITKRMKAGEDDVFHADLLASYKMFRDQFTSKVTLKADNSAVQIDYLDGPFKYLVTSWTFEVQEDGQTQVDFLIDFEFRSAMFQRMIAGMFEKAVRKIMQAFGERAKELYDPLPGHDHPDLIGEVTVDKS